MRDMPGNAVSRDEPLTQRCECCGGRMRVREISVAERTVTLRCENCGQLRFGVPYKASHDVSARS